jgi:carbon monoxide dehydrogenase subunit G
MPSATFHHTATIDAPKDEVWVGLQDPDIWSAIGPVQKVWDPVVEDGVLMGFQWSTDIGGVVYEGTGTAAVQERPHRYELVLDTSEMAGAITIELTDSDPGSTTVDVGLELRSKGLLSSMFFPIVSRAIGDGLPDQVEDLATQLSAG